MFALSPAKVTSPAWRSSKPKAQPVHQPGGSHRQEETAAAKQAELAFRPPAQQAPFDFSKIPPFPTDRPRMQGGSMGPAGSLQRKLTVGQVDDPLEHEADRIADQVVGTAADGLAASRATTTQIGQKKTPDGARAPLGEAPALVHDVLRSPGHLLDAATRAFFEPRFGRDFSEVRVHSDARAGESANHINGLAYTVGNNIVFGPSRFAPGTGGGRRLLAHELAHVVQQGHAAAVDRGGVRLTEARAAPALQRDTPSGQQAQPNIPAGATKQGGQLSVTKGYDPVNASRAEVVRALTDYLNKELALQGGRQLAVTDRVRLAVLKLFQDNPIGYGRFDILLSKSGLPGSPADFAALVGAELPDFIPRKQMLHLNAPPVKAPAPTSTTGEVKQTLKDKLGELGKPPKEVGDPNRPVEAPSNEPTIGSSPGQHTLQTPSRSFGGAPRPSPNPDLPQAPLASDQEAVNMIVQALPDDALVPVAAKGTPQAAEFASAKLLAQSIANQLAEAEAKKRGTVEVTIGQNYRQVEDLAEIFDKTENIVRQIAAALPGGVKDVNKVVISPGRAGRSDRYPPQRVVMLHSGTD
jgi:hypothetical protein